MILVSSSEMYKCGISILGENTQSPWSEKNDVMYGNSEYE